MKDKLLFIALICIAISLSGCTDLSSIHIPWFDNSPTSTPRPISEQFNAIILSETIPDNMLTSHVYNISITTRNSGYDSWSNNNRTMLAPIYDSDNDTVLFNNSSFVINPNTIVKTGSDYTWNITMTSPKWIGIYTIKYQMIDQNNVYFGEPLVENITVGDLNSTVLYLSKGVQYYPSIGSIPIERNAYQNVSITVQNMGRFGWSEDNQFRLGVVDYEPNNATLFNEALLFHIAPEATVNPGEQCTWKFVLHAPSSPGKYRLEYQMKHGDEWLGKPLIVYITVI